MSTIKNLTEAGQKALQDAIDNGELEEAPGQSGVFQYVVEGVTIYASLGTDIIMVDGVLVAQLVDGVDPKAAGDNPGGDITGNDADNFIIGNSGDNVLDGGAGDDQIDTGAGDDTVILGDGDDYVTVNGLGTKTIDGGEGNDTFVIQATGEGSHTTLTGLNAGDKVRLYADANEDGQIDINDVDLDKTVEEDGNTTLVLVDGTTVVLEGVVGLFENANFELGEDDDGELFVDIS